MSVHFANLGALLGDWFVDAFDSLFLEGDDERVPEVVTLAATSPAPSSSSSSSDDDDDYIDMASLSRDKSGQCTFRVLLLVHKFHKNNTIIYLYLLFHQTSH